MQLKVRQLWSNQNVTVNYRNYISCENACKAADMELKTFISNQLKAAKHWLKFQQIAGYNKNICRKPKKYKVTEKAVDLCIKAEF